MVNTFCAVIENSATVSHASGFSEDLSSKEGGWGDCKEEKAHHEIIVPSLDMRGWEFKSRVRCVKPEFE
jgi:hypothetical protein